MRTIKKIHNSRFAPIADLITYSPIPSQSLDQIDPFLFLNHHGYQKYPHHNKGLPFGPHPHRGMETVTFILQGDIMHKDSGGHESIITAGGIQWMTAGRGLIHAETSSEEFKRNGGDLEILQLWLNLPSKFKMTEPKYIGVQKDNIPTASIDDGKVKAFVISGSLQGIQGAIETLIPVTISLIYFDEGGKIELNVPMEHNIFFYVIRGNLIVNGTSVAQRQLVEFNNDNEELLVESKSESILLFGHAKPINEPVVAQGPFVMNTEIEIEEAYNDYRMGKFGKWEG